MRIWVILVLLTITASLLETKVEACFQDSPSVQLRARIIAGVVKQRDKTLDGSVLRLHKFLGAYSVETGHADPQVLDEAVVAKDGSFKFERVPNGKYVVSLGAPSGASIVVELTKPKVDTTDTIAIDGFADSCISVSVRTVRD